MKNFYKKACPPSIKHRFLGRGITLMEALVVIAIISIIVAIAIPSFSNMKKNQLLKNTGEDIISTLDKARSQTLASLDSSEYGVHFAQNSFTYFKGRNYGDGLAGNEVINIQLPAKISNILLSGGATSIYFNRLSGMPNVSGTVIITNGDFTKTITISATGMVNIN